LALRINLSGTGGQGLILAGIILAEAAVLDDKQVVQTQSYGPEARGGASKSEVIISDEVIDYPQILTADILLALSEAACKKYSGNLKKGGRLIVDSGSVDSVPAVDAHILAAPLTKTAREELGNPMFTNIIALGALVGYTQAVFSQSLFQALTRRVPKGTEAVNLQALKLGFSLAEIHGN